MIVSDTTIVTAFYEIPSKHSVAQYKAWIANFCLLQTPMVIFTTEDFVLEFHQWRKGMLDKTEIITRPLDSFAMMCPAMITFWSKQWALDPEKGQHSPELYAVWALKQEFVRIAIHRNPFRSQWFAWCDIGIQRFPELEPFYRHFPVRVPELCEPGRMTLLELEQIPDEYVRAWVEKKPIEWPAPIITLGGGCLVGDQAAWEDFAEAYKEMLQEFAIRGWFAGVDRMVYFVMLMEHKLKKPYRLFFAERFGPPNKKYEGIEWLCFPVILSGAVAARLDTRFEEEENID